MVAINFLSPVRLTTALLPRMLERGRGQILNVSSVAARLSPPGEAAYAASKAAVAAIGRELAAELAEGVAALRGVCVGWHDVMMRSAAAS